MLDQDEKKELEDIEANDSEAEEDLEKKGRFISSVAMHPRNQKLLGVCVVILGLFCMYYFVFSGIEGGDSKKEKKVVDYKKGQQVVKDAIEVTQQPFSVEEETPIPVLADPPAIIAPTPPPPPLINEVDAGVAQPQIDVQNDNLNFWDKGKEEEREQEYSRRRAGIVVVGGGGASGDSEKKDNKDYLGFGEGQLDNNVLGKSSAERAKATSVGNMVNLVTQGKMLDAILETAINTDLPGSLRAIISRDVYGESGREVLIPKGSRVVGQYNAQIAEGQVRVGVQWERLIRPDGIDIKIDSLGVDPLGRSGVRGRVDNKFWTRMSTALLVSYVIPITARKLSNVNDKVITDSDGTQTESSRSAELRDASNKFAGIAEETIKSTFSAKPTITIHQGTRINIFVQKDLEFPSRTALEKMRVLR